MTSNQFIFWIKGYLASQTDSQMKRDIEKALKQLNEEAKMSYTSTGNSTFTNNIKQQLND